MGVQMTITARAPRKYKIDSYDYVFTFGKYKGFTCEKVIDVNPAYILWLNENQVADIDTEILETASIEDAENSPPESWFLDWGDR